MTWSVMLTPRDSYYEVLLGICLSLSLERSYFWWRGLTHGRCAGRRYG